MSDVLDAEPAAEPEATAADVPGPAARPGALPQRATRWWAWLVVAFGAIVGFVVASLAAFDVRIFGRNTVVYAAFGLVVLCAAAAGATVTAFWVEFTHDDVQEKWTPFDPMTRIWFLLAGGILVVFTAWAVYWLLFEAQLGQPQKVIFLGVIAVAVLVGWLLTFLATNPHRLTPTTSDWLFTGVKTVVGVALGVFLAIAPVVAVGVVRTTKTVALPAPPPVDLHGDGYVALGDSYSAGEGLPDYLAGTGGYDGTGSNRCHRSDAAYSQELALGDSAGSTVFVACSGAVVEDLFTGRHQGPDGSGGADVPAQVDLAAPPDPSIGLVTLTMGGNNVDFSKVVTHCLGHDDCTNAPYGEPVNGTQLSLHDWALQEADDLAAKLQTSYGKLRQHYPDARIVVLGYPYLFPGGKAGVTFSDCDTILRLVSTGERTQLRDLQDQLTQRIYDAAVAADVEFVSPVAVWDGHEPCGDRGQYTNAINPVVFDGSFHPNKAGQLAYATLLSCYLDTTQQPATGQRVRLPWETGVNDQAPAPGSLARPVPCPEAAPDR